MRAVIQRVRSGSVTVGGEVVGRNRKWASGAARGWRERFQREAAWLADKTVNLRIFEDSDGKMNLSLLEGRRGGPSVLSVHAVRRHEQGSETKFHRGSAARKGRCAVSAVRAVHPGCRGESRDREVPGQNASEPRK